MIELIILLVISTSFSIFVLLKNREYKENYKKLLSQKKNSEVVLGQIAEQLAPFTDHFKYEPHKVKFLGQPIDYIYFGDDKIVIMEVKSGNSKLTPTQVHIKNLIKNKQVFWEEFRIPDKIKPQPTI
jgi:predicted Holliday junction resolvase-like endonuclease